MTQRQVPPADAIYPIIAASGRHVNPANESPAPPLVVTLSVGPDAVAAGREIERRVREACEADDLKTVSLLLALFPNVVPHIPSFHGLMNELVEKQDQRAIATVYREPDGPGRRHGDEFEWVAILEYVLKAQGFTKLTEAVAWLAEYYEQERERARKGERTPDEPALPAMPTAKTLRNQHAKLREVFRLWSGSYCVPPELVVMKPWRPPGGVPKRPALVATRLSNSVCFHAPEDSVRELPNKKES